MWRSKDEGRPDNLKGQRGTSKVKATCQSCMDDHHDECLGRAAGFRVKCLCAWLGHKDIEPKGSE